MKLTLLIAFAAAALAAAPAQTVPARRHAAKPVQPLTIPKNAVKTDDGYRVTDAKGKVWIYRETPFGVTRSAYKAPEPAPAPDPAHENKTTAKEVGDSIEFERTGPFGASHWQKKKSELTADERAIWDRSKK